MNLGFPGQAKVNHALWKDSIDRLGVCLGGSTSHYLAVAQIRPANGVGPSFSISDRTIGDGCRYTGNLNIPEDRRYILTLTVYGKASYADFKGSTTFYT